MPHLTVQQLRECDGRLVSEGDPFNVEAKLDELPSGVLHLSLPVDDLIEFPLCGELVEILSDDDSGERPKQYEVGINTQQSFAAETAVLFLHPV